MFLVRPIKHFFLLILGVLLTSCMTAEEARIKYDNQSEMQLCVDYMSLPDINIWQSDRAAAIQRRGIDCSPYIEMARLKSQRDDAFQQTLQDLSTLNSNQNTFNSNSSGFTTNQRCTKILISTNPIMYKERCYNY